MKDIMKYIMEYIQTCLRQAPPAGSIFSSFSISVSFTRFLRALILAWLEDTDEIVS